MKTKQFFIRSNRKTIIEEEKYDLALSALDAETVIGMKDRKMEDGLIVKARTAGPKAIKLESKGGWTDDPNYPHTRTDSLNEFNVLVFKDQALAERVAKALKHAIKLCGGKETKEPF